MSDDGAILYENVALLDGDARDPFWGGRLDGESPVASLGETFILNGLVSPTALSVATLVPDEAASAAGGWLARSITQPEDELYRLPDGETALEAPVLRVSELVDRVGAALEGLPAPYADWRLTTEIYVLEARSLYLLAGDLAVRHKLLSETELGIVYGQRMLPFLPVGDEQCSGAMLFVVGIPSRGASLGGLRGYRRGLIDAGQALAALRAVAEPGDGRWWWTTEFFDDACARVLGVDGVERIPLALGAHLLPKEDG